MAVVGAGYFGELHARNLAANDEAQLVAIVDPDLGRAGKIAQDYGGRPLPDIEALADLADAACLAVPTVLHAQIGGKLLEAGLDLLVEKPIAASRAEAETLIETARRHGRVLQVGHLERFGPAFQEAARLAGRPFIVEAERLGPFRHRGLDVSVVLDLMIHDIDLVTALLGSEVVSVEAEGSPILSPAEDLVTARLTFASGAVARLTASRVSREVRRVLRLYGPEGYLSVDLVGSSVSTARIDPDRPDAEGYPGLASEFRPIPSGNNIAAEQRAFLDAVRARRTPVVTGEDGLVALDLALRVEEAARAWRRRVLA